MLLPRPRSSAAVRRATTVCCGHNSLRHRVMRAPHRGTAGVSPCREAGGIRLETSSRFCWFTETYNGPQFTGICSKSRGVRFHRIRDFKQYYVDSIPPTSHLLHSCFCGRRRSRSSRREGVRFPKVRELQKVNKGTGMVEGQAFLMQRTHLCTTLISLRHLRHDLVVFNETCRASR